MHEVGAPPTKAVVASRAIRRESGLLVVGLVGAVEVLLVTSDALLGDPTEDPSLVAWRAGKSCVCALQWPLVREVGTGPPARVVAEAAFGREARSAVIRLLRAIVFGPVTAHAVPPRRLEVAPLVTDLASLASMGACERPSVGEVAALPSGGLVADCAVRGESRQLVVGVLRVVVGVPMAGDAILVGGLVVAASVALLAGDGEMFTDQRPWVSEIGSLPTRASVAFAAIR